MLRLLPASTFLIQTDSPFRCEKNNPTHDWSTALTSKTSEKWSFIFCTIVLRISNAKHEKKDNNIPCSLGFHLFSCSSSMKSPDFSSKGFLTKKARNRYKISNKTQVRIIWPLALFEIIPISYLSSLFISFAIQYLDALTSPLDKEALKIKVKVWN